MTRTREQADLFCRISTVALRKTKWDEDRAHNSIITQLLDSMVKVVDYALNRGWQNCGSYTDLDGLWLEPLYRLFYRRAYNNTTESQQVRALFPHELVASLARCRHAGLLTGNLRYLCGLLEMSEGISRETGDDRREDSWSSYGLAAVIGNDIPDVETSLGHPMNALSMPRFASSTPQYSSNHSALRTEHHATNVISVYAESNFDISISTPSEEPSYRLQSRPAFAAPSPSVSLISPSTRQLIHTTSLSLPRRCHLVHTMKAYHLRLCLMHR